MRTAMTLDQAKAEVEALLEAQPGNKGSKCSIYLWWGDKPQEAPACVGVRVAEVSFVKSQDAGGMCGSSYMTEPDTLGIFAAVERCIIERMVCTWDDETWDAEVADADWRLLENLKEPA